MRLRSSAVLVCLLTLPAVLHAQFGREAVWMTAGSNAQRSSWVKADGLIATGKLVPGFQFLWKIQLDKPGMGAPGEPILMERYIGYRGFRALAFMGTIAGGVYAVDTDLNRVEWQQHSTSASHERSAANCAAVISPSVTLSASTEFPTTFSGGGSGRSGVAKSAVGEPFEGAVTIKPALAAAALAASAPPRNAPPMARTPILLYSVSSDGMFHEIYVSNGEESKTPVKFVPPASVVRGLIVVNGKALAVAGEPCGANDQVVSLDLATHEVTNWNEAGLSIAGAQGAAIAPDGTLFIATAKGSAGHSSSIVALDGKTLQPKDWYTVPDADFTSTPVVLQYKNKVLVAAASKDGAVYVLNAKDLGGEDHRTPLAKLASGVGHNDFVPGSLAVWQDARLTHWLLASSRTENGGITAWKLADNEQGNLAIEPGWTSTRMYFPAAPLIINGVAFSVSNTLASGAGHSAKTVLYALDGATGRELWNSKASIASPALALSAGAGRVYVTTSDGALYAFGFPMEH